MQSISLTDKPDVKWEDCAGLQGVEYLLKEATTEPGKTCRAILLSGPPGTGKSLAVNAAVTNAKDSNYIWVSAYQLRSESEVKSLFSLAKDNTPCIIYIDDVDALCDPDGSGQFTEDLKPAKAEFIDKMGGVKHEGGLLVIAATNKPWRMHSDIVTVFEKRINVPLPDVSTRALIFQRNIPPETDLSDDDIRILSEQSEGFTGADITIVVRDAQMQQVPKIQKATHFKQVQGNKLTPCSPDTPGAVEMGWMQVPADKLLEPKTEMADFVSALQRNRPSVGRDEVQRFDAFSETFGLEKWNNGSRETDKEADKEGAARLTKSENAIIVKSTSGHQSSSFQSTSLDSGSSKTSEESPINNASSTTGTVITVEEATNKIDTVGTEPFHTTRTSGNLGNVDGTTNKRNNVREETLSTLRAPGELGKVEEATNKVDNIGDEALGTQCASGKLGNAPAEAKSSPCDYDADSDEKKSPVTRTSIRLIQVAPARPETAEMDFVDTDKSHVEHCSAEYVHEKVNGAFRREQYGDSWGETDYELSDPRTPYGSNVDIYALRAPDWESVSSFSSSDPLKYRAPCVKDFLPPAETQAKSEVERGAIFRPKTKEIRALNRMLRRLENPTPSKSIKTKPEGRLTKFLRRIRNVLFPCCKRQDIGDG